MTITASIRRKYFIFDASRNNVSEITATGIEALTVRPTFSTSQSIDATYHLCLLGPSSRAIATCSPAAGALLPSSTLVAYAPTSRAGTPFEGSRQRRARRLDGKFRDGSAMHAHSDAKFCHPIPNSE